ncbi:MAG: DUF4962 domain-containing protein [Armatimonadota bacterium]
MPNPGFEQVDEETADRAGGILPAQWRARGSTHEAHRLTEEARSEKYAAQIDFTEGDGTAISGYYYSEPQPLPPCEKVTVSAWVNLHVPEQEHGKHQGAFLRLMFEKNEEYVKLLNSRPVGDTGGEWVELTLTGTPPPEADMWRMSVEFNGIGTARFDDCDTHMTPLPKLPGADLSAPTNELFEPGDGAVGMLGTAREPSGEMVAETNISGSSALPPTIHVGAVWYQQGEQLGVHEVARKAWQRPTEVTLKLRALSTADVVRSVVYAASREEWDAAQVTPPELTPLQPEPPLEPADIEMSGHPRLFISPAHLQRLRELVAMDRETLETEHPHFAHHLKIMLRDADACFDEEKITVYSGRYSTTMPPAVPPRHEDNFPYWTGLSREIEWRVEKLATAYLLTREQKYADLCKEWTLALCEWPQWTDPDYGNRNCCLDTGHFCHAVAFAYDFLYDVLTPSERETLRNALLEKGAAAVIKDATEGWAQKINWPNGFAVVMGGMGIAGVATYGDDPRAEKYVNYARRRIDEFFDTRDRDGGYIEGHTYGGYAMSHIMPFAGTLAVHGDDTLMSNPYLPKTLRFITYCLDPMSATSVNFCDSSYSARAYRSMAAWMARNGDGLAHWYLAHDEGLTHSFRWVPPIGLLWLPLDGSPALPEGWAAGAHYRDIGWTIARSGFSDTVTPGKPQMLLAMRSGPYGSHCQRDQNSFMLNINGRWLLQDPGYGRDATSLHSTLLVDGHDQVPADAHVEAFGNVGDIVYAVGDASVCYSELDIFRRHIIMVAGEYVVVCDQVELQEEPTSISSQLMTGVKKAQIDEAGTIRLIPDSDDPSAAEQGCSIWLPRPGNITTEEYRGHAKIINHYDRGGLKSMLLWPNAADPQQRAVSVANGDVLYLSVGEGAWVDHLVLNLTGQMQTAQMPGSPKLTTDARLVWVRTQDGEVTDLSIVWGSRLEMDGTLLHEFDAKQDFSR